MNAPPKPTAEEVTFIENTYAFVESCGRDKARLFFVAFKVLEAMQEIDRRAAPTSPTPAQEADHV